MELAIGTKFTYQGKTYEIIKYTGCRQCAFYRSHCGILLHDNIISRCEANQRTDQQNVAFKEIKDIPDKINKTLPIGTVVECNGKKFVARRFQSRPYVISNCSDCKVPSNICNRSIFGNCSSKYRSDNKDIYFNEIKTDDIYNDYKTLPIGTIIEFEGIKYIVKEYIPRLNTNNCRECEIPCRYSVKLHNITGECIAEERSDNKDIYFKRLETNDYMNNNTAMIANDNCVTEVQVNIPEGYEIDVENSDLVKGIIKFKKHRLTLNDIRLNNANKVTSGKTMTKIRAIALLMDIANHYNVDWKPDFNDKEQDKYCICVKDRYDNYDIDAFQWIDYGFAYFKNKEDCQSVIDNPNFRDILDTIFKS